MAMCESKSPGERGWRKLPYLRYAVMHEDAVYEEEERQRRLSDRRIAAEMERS